MDRIEGNERRENDLQEIEKLLHRYCRSMDRLDHELGYSVWDGDGSADYGDIFKGTGRAFIDYACEFHSGLVSTSHRISNISVNVTGERAGSETYVIVDLLEQADGRYTLRTGRGRYLDEWIKRDGRWGIAHRRFIFEFLTEQVMDQLPIGQLCRDGRDPSYALLGEVPGSTSSH